MYRKYKMLAYVIFALAIIGFLAKFFQRPSDLIIPVVIFGLVFLLYKFPPKRRQRGNFVYGPQRTAKKPRFRVIRGARDTRDDEPPRYH